MNRNDVIDVLTLIAAVDHRTVGNADVIAWSDSIAALPRDFALRAVSDFRREQPGDWLEPGHVYQRARAMMRDELEHEPDAFREARQAALEAKAADEPVTAYDGEIKFHRPTCNWMAVPCPHCHAGPLKHCVVPGTRTRPHGGTHPARLAAARSRSPAVESQRQLALPQNPTTKGHP